LRSTPTKASSPFKAKLLEPVERFFQIEASSGILLLAAAVVALLWANSPFSESYTGLWHLVLTAGAGEHVFARSLHFWISDGLMTVFFLLVGLEIRREIHEGALASFRLAALPLVAAIGGVVVPALLFLALNRDPATKVAWAVPTATDIAFAIGALSLLGSRVPPGLRVLLLAVAIIDDVIAILVIALYYSSGVVASGLLVAAAGVVGVFLLQKLGVRVAFVYVLPGAVVWAGFLIAGIHPTLAGVLLGLLTPVTPIESREGLLARAGKAAAAFRERLHSGEQDLHRLAEPVRELKIVQRELLPPVVRVQLALHPWVAFGIMPLFALANAGVTVDSLDVAQLTGSLFVGIGAGLVLGKPLGICAAIALVVYLRWCNLPIGVGIRGVTVMGCLAGIGFTMSIFIADLALPEGSALNAAKLAVLAASVVSALVGLALGMRILRPAPVDQSDQP